MHYTYVLQSAKNGTLYKGYTSNLAERFEQHRKGAVPSTRDLRPLSLVYYESCLAKADALHREKYFKTYRGQMFLKRRLKSYFTGLHPKS